ncbi:MAG: hypothetical protein CVT80_03410 [Alphaproteobacteria bacterium HGW-Alphaproteobacteria-2]|nr:MAG: hypothetical protein CVT80_03410 [Alphaproteobacteria bacterium HGW-Alphaproteobacteria-2]
MRLQVSSTLAIFALAELARTPDRQRSVAEIGAIYDVSPHHLSKVMKALVRAGLAQSLRGIGGGYRLSCNPRRVTLLDVVSITRATLGTITLATMVRLMAAEEAVQERPEAAPRVSAQ